MYVCMYVCMYIYVRQAKRDFILEELKHNENNAKKFWKVIREVIPSDKSATKQDILLKNAGNKLGREEVAGFINSYFINVGKIDPQPDVINDPAPSPTSPPEPPEPKDSSEPEVKHELVAIEVFTETEVFRVVKEINVSKSSGLEHFSSFIVKELFGALIPEVTHMYNLSIKKSIFPAAWKSALVVPIPKAGDLTNVKNYRPILLLPLPGKFLRS